MCGEVPKNFVMSFASTEGFFFVGPICWLRQVQVRHPAPRTAAKWIPSDGFQVTLGFVEIRISTNPGSRFAEIWREQIWSDNRNVRQTGCLSQRTVCPVGFVEGLGIHKERPDSWGTAEGSVLFGSSLLPWNVLNMKTSWSLTVISPSANILSKAMPVPTHWISFCILELMRNEAFFEVMVVDNDDDDDDDDNDVARFYVHFQVRRRQKRLSDANNPELPGSNLKWSSAKFSRFVILVRNGFASFLEQIWCDTIRHIPVRICWRIGDS
jgi:hypothetical protein